MGTSRTHTSSNIPYPHCLIETARSEEVGLVIKVDTKHKVRVSFQSFDRCALRNPVFDEEKGSGLGKILRG